ncbi:MAG: hypothetical protein KC656_26055, partial [Myxococcales bacterium]|nr:hypothetical protein [Myxococcales bacterium]
MIHLDHAATSPLHPAVRAAMEPWWGVPCNPSSVHTSGRRAAAAVERAAEQVRAVGWQGRPAEELGPDELRACSAVVLTPEHLPTL